MVFRIGDVSELTKSEAPAGGSHRDVTILPRSTDEAHLHERRSISFAIMPVLNAGIIVAMETRDGPSQARTSSNDTIARALIFLVPLQSDIPPPAGFEKPEIPMGLQHQIDGFVADATPHMQRLGPPYKPSFDRYLSDRGAIENGVIRHSEISASYGQQRYLDGVKGILYEAKEALRIVSETLNALDKHHIDRDWATGQPLTLELSDFTPTMGRT